MTDALIDSLRELVRAEVAAELSKRPDPAIPRLLSVEDAVEALGLSRATVYKEIRSARLRSVKASGRRLVPASAIADYIKELQTGLDTDGLYLAET